MFKAQQSSKSSKSSRLSLVVLTATLACKSGERRGEADDGTPRVAAEPEPAAGGAGEAGEDRIAHARAMTKAFASELQATLLAAIEAGGPAHAIAVCKDDAPKITAAQARDGWTLSRTAPRVRNPANAPTDWQQAVLADWQAKIAAGEVADVAALEWSEVVGDQLRYMRAIPLGGVCLACHGPAEDIAPEVTAALAERYPEDQATGFRVGELRGAFVVTGPS